MDSVRPASGMPCLTRLFRRIEALKRDRDSLQAAKNSKEGMYLTPKFQKKDLGAGNCMYDNALGVDGRRNNLEGLGVSTSGPTHFISSGDGWTSLGLSDLWEYRELI